jgi:uncharacterized protein (DUF885 family)
MAANADILRDGLASGLTAPRIVAERTIAQIERMLDVPIDQAIVPAMLQGAGDADRERVRDVVRDKVYPADRAFLEALNGDYLAATREDPGLWSAPDGDRLYRTAIRRWTTLDLDPEEVHRVGLEELETIELERREIARQAGFGDDTVAYRAALDADQANTPQTKDELVVRAHEDIRRAWPRARALRRAPTGRLRGAPGRGVQGEGRARSRTTTRRRPMARDPDLLRQRLRPARAGKFSKLATDDSITRRRPVTTSRSASRWRTTHLITFGRLGSRMVGGAFCEAGVSTPSGLADEMGLFRSEAERFGMLDAQAWRAARSSSTRGCTPCRWPRQRSIDFLEHGRACRDRRGHRDRPLHRWPGQALTYKIGQREIERLRAS